MESGEHCLFGTSASTPAVLALTRKPLHCLAAGQAAEVSEVSKKAMFTRIIMTDWAESVQSDGDLAPARAAVEKIKVEYEVLHPITTVEEAMKKSAYSIHPDGNISSIHFTHNNLIAQKLQTCMNSTLEKKVRPIKNLSKPIGVRYGYTITSKSKIDFTKE